MVNSTESFITKLIQGDKSDNIKSVYVAINAKGNPRGIGEAGARKIYNLYLKEFGEIKFDDDDLLENLADLVCESKKISYSNLPAIKKNLEDNMRLINLMELPEKVTEVIKKKIDETNQRSRKNN